jgi:hypothetical protein
MRLRDLKHPRTEGDPYVGTLKDSAGDTHYELVISGSSRLIQKVFAESDFEYQIDPNATEKDWILNSQKMWERHARLDGLNTPETIAALETSLPGPATGRNSIVVSVRRTEGQGTWWGWWWPLLALPAGRSLFFTLPPICNCAAFVVPSIGNPDLFLSANGPFTPVIGFSMLGPGAIDRVAFGSPICWPWAEFVPWFRVFASTTCVTGFGIAGFGVVP